MECVSNCTVTGSHTYYDMPERVCMNTCKT